MITFKAEVRISEDLYLLGDSIHCFPMCKDCSETRDSITECGVLRILLFFIDIIDEIKHLFGVQRNDLITYYRGIATINLNCHLTPHAALFFPSW